MFVRSMVEKEEYTKAIEVKKHSEILMITLSSQQRQ